MKNKRKYYRIECRKGPFNAIKVKHKLGHKNESKTKAHKSKNRRRVTTSVAISS